MVFSLTWLPEVLEAAGLKVAETEGWRSRGRAEMGTVRGVICHHTATAGHLDKNMPTLQMLIDGRPDLHGPLAQLGLGRDGTFYIVAAGRANHAGIGRWEGITTGNSSFIGIEAENDGLDKDNWPAVQIDAYQRGVAAILGHINAGANMCCGHKEYALPPRRKSDPSFDMPSFRNAVADLLQGKTPRPPIPAADAAQRPTLRRGARGDAVRQLQGLLHVAVDGVFGPSTEAALRAFQRGANLVPDGIAGPKTWEKLAGAPAAAPAADADPPATPADPAQPAAPAAPAQPATAP
ncbi:MAG: N-acetylmuramoyl-L-alanine amidase, partial [Sphingomonadaceae bacterium]|nr:N-acetylmuramoyl-L-alanine amidase [Sphingomonadaceae bacterium]